MKNVIKQLAIILLLLPSVASAWQWRDLWYTPDQQAAKLLKKGAQPEAARTFNNKEWQAVADYKSGDYERALLKFSSRKTSDGQYNAGNAEANLSHYQEAINAYDKAIALNPNNTDAVANRELVKKLMEQKKQEQSSSAKNQKQNNKDKQNNNSKSSQQAQNNSPSNDDQKNAPNNQQTNSQQNSKDPANQQAQSKKPDETQANNSNPQNYLQDPDAKPETTAAANRRENKDEDKKQLLRRLAEDPGGLLRQKFLRDYLRRHADAGNPDQGGG